jgi:hypothetical protein
MYRTLKVAWFTHGFTPVFQAPAPDGGDFGGHDPVDGGDGDAPSGEDIDAALNEPAPPTSGDADDDDDDDDDDLPTDVPDRTRWEKVRKKLSKLNRRDRRLAPVRERLKELKEQGLSLDDLVLTHRQYRSLEQSIRQNPKLRQALFGGDAEEGSNTSRQPAPQPVEEQFDESSLPFDPNENKTNRYFADLAKKAWEMERKLTQLNGNVATQQQREHQRTEAQVKEAWVNKTDAAAKFIKDKGVQTIFRDAMTAAYHNARGRFTPEQIVNHYLKQLGIDPKQAARANAAAAGAGNANPNATLAARNRVANDNRNQPRTVAPPGAPASAQNGRPTLAGIKKRISSLGK